MLPGPRNCKECGSLFLSSGRGICPRCIEKEDRDFEVVRAYLEDSSGGSIQEISEATGVHEEHVLNFLRNGRLLAYNVEGAALECQVCGVPLDRGQVCVSCCQALESSRVIHKEDPVSSGERMYMSERHRARRSGDH